jgi:hypothetical protein
MLKETLPATLLHPSKNILHIPLGDEPIPDKFSKTTLEECSHILIIGSLKNIVVSIDVRLDLLLRLLIEVFPIFTRSC